MCLNRHSVVLSDLYIDADNPAAAKHLEDRCVQNSAPAMSDAGFYNYCWTNLVQQFLHHQDVFGKLDNWDTQPGQLVRELALPAGLDPQAR